MEISNTGFLSKYSDINPRYKVKNSNIIETGVDAIEGSIENIIGTIPGERVFNPRFGSRVSELLFEPISDSTSQKILFAISDAIQIWEPRIKLILSESLVTAVIDDNEYDISLVYTILDVEIKSQFDLRISL